MDIVAELAAAATEPPPEAVTGAGTPAAAMAADFAAAALQAQSRAHVAGTAYATLDSRGRVVFVHPDGSIRLGCDPNAQLAN